MARLLVTDNSSWYDELSVVDSYYEHQYQKIIKQHVDNVFSDYVTINFKQEILSNNRSPRKPDLAMINKKYNDWWIVEVELFNHSFDHIKDQVEVFIYGNYNAYTTSKYIIKQCQREHKKKLNVKKLVDLIQNQQPKVLVIVDEDKYERDNELKKLNINLCVFQVYKNTKGTNAFRISGDYPIIVQSESHCKYHEQIPNALEILKPDILNNIKKKKLIINYNEKITKWEKIIETNKVYLKAINKVNPVPANKSYVLYKDKNNKLFLKIN